MKGKELLAHIRMLLAQMEQEEKEEFFDDAEMLTITHTVIGCAYV